MKIRQATTSDLNQLVILGNKMLDFHCAFDPYYCIYRQYDDITEFYESDLKKDDRFYVVAETDEGVLAGFASASTVSMPNTTAPAIGHLIANYVLEEYRNQGIGSEFYNKRMEWFKTKNVKHIEMNVDAHNEHALKIWKNKGFKEYQIILKLDL